MKIYRPVPSDAMQMYEDIQNDCVDLLLAGGLAAMDQEMSCNKTIAKTVIETMDITVSVGSHVMYIPYSCNNLEILHNAIKEMTGEE